MISDQDLLETFELRNGEVLWKQIDLTKTHPTLRSRANNHNAHKAGRVVQWWSHSSTGDVISLGTTRVSRQRAERVLAMAQVGIGTPKAKPEAKVRQPRRGAVASAKPTITEEEAIARRDAKLAAGWEQLVTGEWIPPKGGTT